MTLIQKSRRALRLYTSAGAGSSVKDETDQHEFATVQVTEWREVNNLLLRKLTEAANSPNTKRLVYDVFALRGEFQALWRASEAELVISQRELIGCAERGDFVKAAALATSLVGLKARVQAGQAAHHELDLLIRKSRVVRPQEGTEGDERSVSATIELLDAQVVHDYAPALELVDLNPPKQVAAGGAKIIPLRRR